MFTTIKKTNSFKLIAKMYWLAGLLALSSQTTSAKEYMVEVLVFKNLTESRATESNHYEPPKVLDSEAQTWSLEPSMLLEEATALKKSNDYQLLHYYSWGQEALPSSKAAVYDLIETDLSGWIKVYAKTLLFANLDLELNGYRMTEKRRLKLNEKHFFDHPKFGILMQVSRLLPSNTESNEALKSE